MRKSFSGVYALFSGDKIVYVGESKDVYRRISEHTFGRRKTPPKIFDYWEYIEVDDDWNRRRLESAMIAFFQPYYNDHWANGFCSSEDKRIVKNQSRSCEWLLTSIANAEPGG